MFIRFVFYKLKCKNVRFINTKNIMLYASYERKSQLCMMYSDDDTLKIQYSKVDIL